MNRFPGPALMVTGVGHALLGLFLFREPLAAIVREGIANTIRHGRYDREAALWFLLFGPSCFLLGQLVKHGVEHRDRWLLSLVGWNLIGVGAVGALIAPVSGFWILIAIGPLVFRDARSLGAPAGPEAVAPGVRV